MLGALVFILVVVVIFMCVHRRRRPGSLETVAPFAHGQAAAVDSIDSKDLNAGRTGVAERRQGGTLASAAVPSAKISVYTSQARISRSVADTSAAPPYYAESEPAPVRLSAKRVDFLYIHNFLAEV